MFQKNKTLADQNWKISHAKALLSFLCLHCLSLTGDLPLSHSSQSCRCNWMQAMHKHSRLKITSQDLQLRQIFRVAIDFSRWLGQIQERYCCTSGVVHHDFIHGLDKVFRHLKIKNSSWKMWKIVRMQIRFQDKLVELIYYLPQVADLSFYDMTIYGLVLSCWQLWYYNLNIIIPSGISDYELKSLTPWEEIDSFLTVKT